MAQNTISQIALRDCSKEVREKPGDTGVFAGGRRMEGEWGDTQSDIKR